MMVEKDVANWQHEFELLAWEAATAKARQLGWIGLGSGHAGASAFGRRAMMRVHGITASEWI